MDGGLISLYLFLEYLCSTSSAHLVQTDFSVYGDLLDHARQRPVVDASARGFGLWQRGGGQGEHVFPSSSLSCHPPPSRLRTWLWIVSSPDHQP
eukprot:753626-Hanusia_phi.AAC.2